MPDMSTTVPGKHGPRAGVRLLKATVILLTTGASMSKGGASSSLPSAIYVHPNKYYSVFNHSRQM